MRVFAGPNGSGKSTLQTLLPRSLLGFYINADDIEATLRRDGFADLSCYGMKAPLTGIREFLLVSPLFSKACGGIDPTDAFNIDGTCVSLVARLRNSYAAAALAEFVREELIRTGISFTFETVMSHPSKIEFMSRAKAAGFRVYLYFIATADPRINIARVKSRVQSGGHDVPVDKILDRYGKSLNLLRDAIRNSNRAYIFDNSAQAEELMWLAECTDGKDIVVQVKTVSDWFTQHVLDRADDV